MPSIFYSNQSNITLLTSYINELNKELKYNTCTFINTIVLFHFKLLNQNIVYLEIIFCRFLFRFNNETDKKANTNTTRILREQSTTKPDRSRRLVETDRQQRDKSKTMVSKQTNENSRNQARDS